MKDLDLIKILSKALKPYKKQLYAFESQDKKGVLILDQKDKNASVLLNQMAKDVLAILQQYKKAEDELPNFLKEALKEMIFGGGVGAVLMQQSKVIIRGDLYQESVSDLIEIIFLDDKNIEHFIYEGVNSYLTQKINIEFLSVEKIFNIKAMTVFLLKSLIDLIKNNPKIQERLKSSSIKMAELSNSTSPSYLKLSAVLDEIFQPTLKDVNGVFFNAIADFLLRSVAKANATQLKYINEFFNNLLKITRTRSSKINFNVIRRNAVDREKYLKLIDDAKKRIDEAIERENYFIKIADENKKKMEVLEVEVNNLIVEFERVQTASKNTFDDREVLRKQPNGAKMPEYQELSTSIRELTIRKSEVEAELKNTRQKFELAKQAIENANQDRTDYMKLLPELTGVQEKKIKEHESNLKEFQGDYLSAKETIIELMSSASQL